MFLNVVGDYEPRSLSNTSPYSLTILSDLLILMSFADVKVTKFLNGLN